MDEGRRFQGPYGFEPVQPPTFGLGMCCDGSDSLALVRALSGLLARVNNRMLTYRRLQRLWRTQIWPFAGTFATRLGGFEPPTRGFEVNASGLVPPCEACRRRVVERNRLGAARGLWGAVVDSVLTRPGAGWAALEPRTVPRRTLIHWPSPLDLVPDAAIRDSVSHQCCARARESSEATVPRGARPASW
jgi:hypothetical protein